jgi:hypothetical protein
MYMMNPHSKKLFAVLAFALLVSALPTTTFAARGSSGSLAQVTLTTSGKASFCSEIDGLATQALSSITDLEKKYSKKAEDRMQEVWNRRTAQDQLESERRSQAADMRAKAVSELTAKAKSAKEKKALQTFAAQIDTALALRQKKVDDSNNMLRSSVDKVIAQRKAALSAATTTLKSAVDSAVKQAKASCSNKATTEKVKDEFKTNLKKARLSFEAAIQKIASTTPDAAIKVRNDALLSAHKEFNSTLEEKFTEVKKVSR